MQQQQQNNTALGSDGQGPNDFLSGVFDFSDLFNDLARACLGFLESPVELVRVRASAYA